MLFTFSISLLTAQTSKDRLYHITTVEVPPSKFMAYEKAVTDLGEAMIAANAQEVELHVSRTDDLTYFYAVPMDNMEELFTNKWTSTVEKVGEEKFLDLYGKVVACERDKQEGFYLYKADLSYYHASLVGQTQNYSVTTIYQFKPGTEKEVAELTAGINALYKEHDISMSYSLYHGVLGPNNNITVVVRHAKDALTFAQQNVEVSKKIGEKIQPLVERLYPILDKVETKRGSYLSKFSFVPEVPKIVAEKED